MKAAFIQEMRSGWKESPSVAFFPFGVTLSYIKKKTRIQVDVPDDGLVSGSKPCFGQTKTLAPA
jgi:hypothetical protein